MTKPPLWVYLLLAFVCVTVSTAVGLFVHSIVAALLLAMFAGALIGQDYGR